MTAYAIFHIGPVALTLTGLMCALGLTLLVALSACLRGLSKPVGKRRLTAYFVFSIPSALILARAAYCLCGPERFAGRFFALFALHAGGYSFTVLLLGFVLAALAYAHVYNIDKLQFLDLLAPGLLLLFMLLRFSEIDPAQSTGHVVTSRLIRSGLLTAVDRYGSVRHAVARMEGLAALAVFAACAVHFFLNRRADRQDEPAERFCFAAAALFALVMPIEGLRDGLYPAVFGVPLDMLSGAVVLAALCAFSALQLWKTDIARQFVLVRAIPGAILPLLALPLAPRAAFVASPETNSLWILAASLASAFLTYSLRAARLRRVRAKKAAETNFVVRIPPEDPAKPAVPLPADLEKDAAPEEAPAGGTEHEE